MSDYPELEDLEIIKHWEFTRDHGFAEFMETVRLTGNYWPEGFCWKQRGRTYWISTGGWSGNEEILSVMMENLVFWSVCWDAQKRGGHYKFTIPNPKTYWTP